MANLDELTKRINVLVKTNNRLALEFQKALARSESERNAVEEMIYRISRDITDVTDEIVIDEEYYGIKKAREAVQKAEATSLLQIERERAEAHKRIAELKEASSKRIEELESDSTRRIEELENNSAKRIAQQEEIFNRELEALKREVQAFHESSETFKIATEAHVREVEAISNAVEEKIKLLNESSRKSFRARNWVIATLSVLIPAFYFLGDYIDLLEILM